MQPGRSGDAPSACGQAGTAARSARLDPVPGPVGPSAAPPVPDWWAQEFSNEASYGVDWKKAGKALMQRCHEIGIFQPDGIRGRGFWRDEDDQIIVHLGDRLLPPSEKEFLKPEKYNGAGRIYTRLPRIAGPSEKAAMRAEESQVLLDMFTSRTWDDEASGYLLAGWTALAPFSGALPWRPHIWLTGSSGSGKTTLSQRMVMPLLGGMGLYTEGATTEAGIRQALEDDALPVVLDDVEYVDTGQAGARQARARIRALVGLARSSSSGGGRILRGPSSPTNSFRPTSAFVFSSVAVGLCEEADKSRFSVLTLTSPRQLDPVERREEWESFQPDLARYCTTEAGQRLIARTLEMFRTGHMAQLEKVVKSVANIVLGDARAAEQLGTLATGAWSMMTDGIPEEAEVVQWLHTLELTRSGAGDESEGFLVLREILQEVEGVRTDSGHQIKTIAELVASVAAGPTAPTTTVTYAIETLERCGVKVKGLPDEEQFLAISIRSEWVEKRLARTPHADNWIKALRKIPVGGPGRRPTSARGSRVRVRPRFL